MDTRTKQMRIRICYKVLKESSLEEDSEDIYICVKVSTDSYNISQELYSDLVGAYKKIIAYKLKVDPKYVVNISINEYLDNTEEE